MSGLFVYDISQLVTDSIVEIYKLNSALVGVNDVMAMSEYSSRIAFIRDYDHLSMIPLVHRNTISFLGMLQRQDYLIMREYKETMTALSRYGEITSWSTRTGLILDKQSIFD